MAEAAPEMEMNLLQQITAFLRIRLVGTSQPGERRSIAVHGILV